MSQLQSIRSRLLGPHNGTCLICPAPLSAPDVYIARGATTAEKLRGTKVWVPYPGACTPRPAKGQRPRGSPPPAKRVRRHYLRKIFENSDAKSCILVTTCCEISCFLKTTAKKLGDQYQSPPVPTVVAPICMATLTYSHAVTLNEIKHTTSVRVTESITATLLLLMIQFSCQGGHLQTRELGAQ